MSHSSADAFQCCTWERQRTALNANCDHRGRAALMRTGRCHLQCSDSVCKATSAHVRLSAVHADGGHRGGCFRSNQGNRHRSSNSLLRPHILGTLPRTHAADAALRIDEHCFLPGYLRIQPQINTDLHRRPKLLLMFSTSLSSNRGAIRVSSVAYLTSLRDAPLPFFAQNRKLSRMNLSIARSTLWTPNLGTWIEYRVRQLVHCQICAPMVGMKMVSLRIVLTTSAGICHRLVAIRTFTRFAVVDLQLHRCPDESQHRVRDTVRQETDTPSLIPERYW